MAPIELMTAPAKGFGKPPSHPTTPGCPSMNPRRVACSSAQTLNRTVALVALLASAGCSTFVARDSPLPSNGPTMAEIFRSSVQGGGDAADAGVSDPREQLPRRAVDADTVSAQRRALSEAMNNRFQRLPNVDLTMLVFPHLAQGRYPVPGYETVFPMYESVAYAMPGEVAPRHPTGGQPTQREPRATPAQQPAARAAKPSAPAQREQN